MSCAESVEHGRRHEKLDESSCNFAKVDNRPKWRYREMPALSPQRRF